MFAVSFTGICFGVLLVIVGILGIIGMAFAISAVFRGLGIWVLFVDLSPLFEAMGSMIGLLFEGLGKIIEAFSNSN
jgi:hypothetical protein